MNKKVSIILLIVLIITFTTLTIVLQSCGSPAVETIEAEVYYDPFDYTVAIENDEMKISLIKDEMHIFYKGSNYRHYEFFEADSYFLKDAGDFIEVIKVIGGEEEIILKVVD